MKTALTIVSFGFAGAAAGLLCPFPSSSHPTPSSAARRAADTTASSPALAPPPPPAARSVAREPIEIEEGPVITDPAAPGYDPTTLRPFGISSEQIFEREPRDPSWAPAMERTMKARMTEDLELVQPAVRVQTIECRTSTCMFEVAAPEHIGESAQFALQLLGNADVHTLANAERFDDGSETILFYALFAPEHRNLADNASYYAARRAKIFEQALGAPGFDLTLPIPPQERSR